MRGLEFLEKAIRKRFEGRVVLMASFPFSLPLRVDFPSVDPTEWEEEEDGD